MSLKNRQIWGDAAGGIPINAQAGREFNKHKQEQPKKYKVRIKSLCNARGYRLDDPATPAKMAIVNAMEVLPPAERDAISPRQRWDAINGLTDHVKYCRNSRDCTRS